MLTCVDRATNATGLRPRTFAVAALCVLVLLLGSASVSKAQIYYGTITGTVTDSTGAVVSGATVTVKNVATGATYTATTTDSGSYVVAQSPIGIYEVRIGQKGFKEFVATNVEVHTSSDTRVDAQLQLGAATEVVQVEASDVQVETTSGAVGNVIEGTQVRELPLNGENFMGLVTLTPGVSPAQSFNSVDKGLTGGADFSVNGNPYNYNLFLVDGVNNNDVGSGRTILVYPSVDTIAEFKMITNSYGPEYGQATGSIISITTKSGTNQFHGGFFYAGRNDALDANDFFSNLHKTGKAELRRNDWGYNISGPVIKNKLFFWWNQEWDREIAGQSVSACVPSAAERAGDFSADEAYVTNPPAGITTNGGALCGATVPTIPAQLQAAGNPYKFASVDPTAQLLAAIYPLPNVSTPLAGYSGQPTNYNWAQAENGRPDWSEWNVRADYDITKKNRATFRYTNDSWTSPGPNPNLFWGDSNFPTINSDWSQPSKSVMAKLTTQVSDTMVNDFEFGYGHNAIITTLEGTGGTINGTTYNGLSLVKAIDAAIPTAFPESIKSAPAFPQIGWGGAAPYGSGNNLWTIAPYGNHEDLYAFQDNVSKVHGNHVWKVGAYFSTNAKIENNNGGTDQPLINPASYAVAQNTGNQLANMLLPGQLFTTTENSINQVARVHWHDFEWYAGDTFKIRRNVTVTYGFRWSFLREPYSGVNQLTSWSLANWSAARATADPSDACNGILVVPGTNPCGAAAAQLAALGVTLPLSSGTPGVNSALVNNNNHMIAPRLGVAWDPWGDGKTAVRAGIGQFFQREPVGLDEGRSFNAPFVINATDVRTLETPAPLANPAVSPCCSKSPQAVVPNSWQWNLSVEHEIAKDMALQLGYVGNAGIHLTSGLDLNALPKDDWVEGAFLSSSALNALRPAFNFGTIMQFQRMGHASYNSLQALYRWKWSNYSQLQASYTYSHSIGNVLLNDSSGSVDYQAVTDQSERNLDKGNTDINRPHIFVLSEVIYLPKLANHSTAVREAFGGWELNSIVSVSSGSSLGIYANSAGAYVPQQATGGTGPCSQNDINNGTCVFGPGWTAANGTPGISALSSLQGSGYGNNNRPNRTGVSCNAGENGYQILNPAAFTAVGFVLGNDGTAPRGYCFGPDYRNVDSQLAKNWYFKEHYRIKFSMDFFNLFNHPNFYGSNLEGSNFSASNLICGSIVPGNGTAADPDHYLPCSPTNNVVSKQVGNNNQSFGQSNAVHPGRELQYTLRFYF